MTANHETQKPYGYVKPKGDWAVSPFFVFAEDLTQEWMKGVFTKPVYESPPLGLWEPAQSAPRDGSEVLLWLGAPYSRKTLARWYEPWGVWIEGNLPRADDERHGIGSQVPTHWLRTPDGPPEMIR